MIRNAEIRDMALKSGIKLWEIANALSLTDGNFSRKLRKELPDEEKQRIFGIIEDLSKSHEGRDALS